MKIERQIKEPKLYDFAAKHPPRNLVLIRRGSGYSGFEYLIYASADVPRFWRRGDPIASIWTDSIMLYEPKYFSDMEDLARRYEESTGHEITLKYWQSPKDEPIK